MTFPVVAQAYTTGSSQAYVIVGNSALLKCEIPSFVADFVSVVSWVDNEATEYFNTGQSLGKKHFVLADMGITSNWSISVIVFDCTLFRDILPI